MVLPQSSKQILLAKFFAAIVNRLRDAVGIEGEQVSGSELELGELALPILKQTQQGCRGMETAAGVVWAKNQAGEVSAVGVAQASRVIVLFGEEKRSVGAVDGVLEKETVDGAQEKFRMS